METTNKVKVMYDSDEAAQLKTVTGWVSRDGRFFGEHESVARYSGCTHKTCECGNVMEKMYTRCEACREKSRKERYEALPFKEWDGKTPLFSRSGDRYFFDEDDLICYCEDEDIQSDDLDLVICEPNHYMTIDEDHWVDVLPEDGEIPKLMQEALAALNEVIEKLPPASWSEGKFRTSYAIPA